jgi:hypothetical protein
MIFGRDTWVTGRQMLCEHRLADSAHSAELDTLLTPLFREVGQSADKKNSPQVSRRRRHRFRELPQASRRRFVWNQGAVCALRADRLAGNIAAGAVKRRRAAVRRRRAERAPPAVVIAHAAIALRTAVPRLLPCAS